MEAKKILLVDDQSEVLEFLQEELESEGHTVLVASSGIEAFNTLNKVDDIDLMVSDVEMPEMDGVELLDKINSEIPNKPPMFFMTGVSPQKRMILMKNGALEVLLKPFTYQQLVKSIYKHLENNG